MFFLVFKTTVLKHSVLILGRMYKCPLSLKILFLFGGCKQARGCSILELMSAQSLASDCLNRSLKGVVHFKYPNLTDLSCNLLILQSTWNN